MTELFPATATATAPAETVPEAPVVRTPMARLGGRRRSPWIGRAVFVGVVALVALWPYLLDDPTRTRQWAEYFCYAAIAVGIDIAWGYGGMLVLGQGLFFGLGAYAMGMHLSLEQVGPGELPAFMSLYGDQTELPLIWKPFQNLWVSVVLALVVPMLVAGLLGWLVFSRRIRGPYFALLTQAMALVFVLVLIGQLKTTAGTNGLTDFATVFGRNRYEPSTNTFLYFLAAGVLVVVFLVARHLIDSRYGRLLLAVRYREDRVRFLGYNPAVTKTLAFVVAAGMAGAAGAVAAPVIGIVAPNQFTILPSILMVCWVAVGGRGTLYGAILGAVLVGWLRTTFSESRPDDWQYLQGLLFVVVVAFIPGGIIGLVRSVGAKATAAAGMTAGLLELRGVVVDFDGFKAVDGVDLTIDEGELRFLIGPNGAGKTSLVDVISGLTKPSEGDITFAGQSLLGVSAARRVRLGIGRSFQTPTVFDSLTVVENLDLAETYRSPLRALLRRRKGMSDTVTETLARIGLTEGAERPAAVLSHGQKQWLEIGMLLVQRPKLMLLDEPVAGMSGAERQATGELLQELAVDHTVVVIEHDMAFLRKFARSVTVLHEGKVLSEGDVDHVQNDPIVREVYLGRSRDARSGAVTP